MRRFRRSWLWSLATGVAMFAVCLMIFFLAVPQPVLSFDPSVLPEVSYHPIPPGWRVPVAGSSARPKGVWLVRANEEWRAFSDAAPHPRAALRNCRVEWSADLRMFFDPCWGSYWLMSGRAMAGPAPRGLDRFPVRIAGGELRIIISDPQLGVGLIPVYRKKNPGAFAPGFANSSLW